MRLFASAEAPFLTCVEKFRVLDGPIRINAKRYSSGSYNEKLIISFGVATTANPSQILFGGQVRQIDENGGSHSYIFKQSP